MLDIVIKTIPHKDQRYDTCGDWWWEGDTLHVRISEMSNYMYEWLVAEHEVNEAMMCKRDGIGEDVVTDFDKRFEKLRLEHPDLIGDHEPGSMVSAPYYAAHRQAYFIEKQSAKAKGIDWHEYENQISKLNTIPWQQQKNQS